MKQIYVSCQRFTDWDRGTVRKTGISSVTCERDSRYFRYLVTSVLRSKVPSQGAGT